MTGKEHVCSMCGYKYTCCTENCQVRVEVICGKCSYKLHPTAAVPEGCHLWLERN